MNLIVGLGNPGKDYMDTRHNAGFLALDELAARWNLGTFSFDKKFQSEVASGSVDGHKVLLLKPQTYMNESGVSVRAVFDFYKLSLGDVLVVHDDKDIPLGETRWHSDRGPAGHNGIVSIITHLGSQAFTRLRLGIAPATDSPIETSEFVLGHFSTAEKTALLQSCLASEDRLRSWLH